MTNLTRCGALWLLMAASLAAGAADPAVDPAEAARRIEREAAWLRAKTVGAYDQFGLRNPKWDAHAKAAIMALERRSTHLEPVTGDETELMWGEAGRAYALGCRDPLFLYAGARSGVRAPQAGMTLARQHAIAADALRGSRYHPTSKAYAFARAAQYAAREAGEDAAARAAAVKLAEEAIALLPEVFADREMPVKQAADMLDVLWQASRDVYGDWEKIPMAIIAAAEKAGVPEATVLSMRGEYHCQTAWEARGGGFANTVTPDGWKAMEKHMASGRDALQRAWAADPLNYHAATEMLSIETGDTRGRDEMEKWYARAMRAWPGNRAACELKMGWLEPKWHGSIEDMIAFGRELRDQGNWDALLPMMLVDAHWAASTYPPGGAAKPRPAYFQGNAAAWDDVKGVTEEYLKRAKVPSPFHGTRFAIIAAWSGHWAEADMAFNALGESHNRSLIPLAAYRQLREEAREKAGKK
jgi:hypothetical protein